jgi:glycosyltransferase involved in cell wall biosynthesis
MSKKIWVICKYASPEKYFFGTRHFYLSEEWVKQGHDVTIFTSNSSHLTNKLPTFGSSRMIEHINGVRTVWLKAFKSNSSSSVIRVVSWIQFEFKVLLTSKRNFSNPDIIIASSLSILSIISAFILSKKYNAKFILEIRDIWPLSIIQLGGFSTNHPFIWFLSKLEKFGYRNADVIVGTMPNLIEHVESVEPKYNKCICVPQGITEYHLMNHIQLSDQYINEVFEQGTFKIAYAGTLNQNNPIDILLKAVSLIPRSELIEVYIIGTGTMLKQYKLKYKQFSQIKFIDPIPKIYINSFLQQVDICFDSIDSEIAKFGISRNKWIDYMCSSRPIVCSFSGYQSMINEAECGVFVPYGDVEKLIEIILIYRRLPKEAIKKIGERGFEFLLKNRLFSKLAKDYQNVF